MSMPAISRDESPAVASRYLIVSSQGVYEDVSWDGFKDIILGLHGSPDEQVVIGYDVHLGFNFPDLTGFVQALSHTSRPMVIEPAMIDERESSGRNPFSPTQAVVEIGGRLQRHRIASASLRSLYLSQIELELDRVAKAYQHLAQRLYREAIAPLIAEARAHAPRSLGALCHLMHDALLRRQLAHLPHVTIAPSRYDAYDPALAEVAHPADTHVGHHLIFIGLSKAAVADQKFIAHLVEVLQAVQDAGASLTHIVTPQDSHCFFRLP